MSTFLGCIADDFTGATDLAGMLARSGLPVNLRIGIPSAPPEDTAVVEVIALKCRTEEVGAAVADCSAALDWLKAAGAQRFYWKYCSTFDSTAAGNIGPVAEALMAALGTDQTIYCPSFPENGRTVYMGNLFVGRLLLSESPMKDHPLTPMTDANLMRVLEPQVTRPVGLADLAVVQKGPEALAAALAKLRAEGCAHVVVDAVADGDLATIAAACSDMPLVTGGSALAAPLMAAWKSEGALGAADDAGAASIGPASVVLSGSCSSMTRQQVERYAATGAPCHRLDPLALHEAGTGAAHDWLAAQDLTQAPLIYATAEPEQVRAAQAKLGVHGAGAIVERALAELAVAARERGARRFVVAGGETSGAVTQGLGIDRLRIGPEIAPGVPWCFAQSGGADVAITLKSGNFGSPGFFGESLALLAESTGR